MSELIAVVDANILVPNILRDVFVSLAFAGVYAARWTDQIHQEWIRNVLKLRPEIARSSLERVRALMDANVKNALVSDYESLIETLELPDADDRHVLAAAIVAHAKVIVTNNIRDFPASALAPHGVETRKPDAFLCELWPDNSAEIIVALSRQRARLHNPPQSPAEFLESLKRQGLTRFADTLTPFQTQL